MKENKAREAANWQFVDLSATYHDGIPVALIDRILQSVGFKVTEPGIYCGSDGRIHEQVGERTWLAMTWHRMEVTGRFEIIAYVS